MEKETATSKSNEILDPTWWVSDDIIQKGVDEILWPKVADEMKQHTRVLEPSTVTAMVLAGAALFQQTTESLHGIQGTKLGKISTFIMPLNLHNAHWILLLVDLQTSPGRVEVYDSLRVSAPQFNVIYSTNCAIGGLILALKQDTDTPHWIKVLRITSNALIPIQYKVADFPQNNGNDCGIYVFEKIRHLLNLGAPSLNQQGLNATRLLLQKYRTVSETPDLTQLDFLISKTTLTAFQETQKLEFLGMALSTLMMPRPTPLSRMPQEIKTLFDLVDSTDPNAEEQFCELLKNIPLEHFGKRTRFPRYAKSMPTDWADGRPEDLGLVHLVLLKGNNQMLKALLDKGVALSTIAESYSTQRNELFIATEKGNYEAVKMLLDKGCKDDQLISCGLHYGVKNYHLDDALSDPLQSGFTSQLTNPSNSETISSLNELIKKSENVSTSWCYLHCIHVAIIKGYDQLAKLLLMEGNVSHMHASLNNGWVDIAIMNKQEKTLNVVLEYLLEQPLNKRLIQMQSCRFSIKDLPSDCLEWVKNLHNDLFNKFSAVLEDMAREAAETIKKSPFVISIKTLTGRIYDIACNENETVVRLKSLIEEQAGIPVDQQRIIFAGKQLADENCLSDYGVVNGSKLALVLRMLG